MKPLYGKYTPLFRHLTGLDGNRWPAKFQDVEGVLGFPLPKSANAHSAWWANDGSHSQARAWQQAGWQTCDVDLGAATLVFERQAPNAAAIDNGGGQRTTAPENGITPASKQPISVADDTHNTLTLGGETFRLVARISPELASDGKPAEDMPQKRYRAEASLPLNRHGHGPFCRFSVAGLPAAPGVYAVTVAQQLAYVGITANLQQRWGTSGYARIQPRNCFVHGQSTNCKVNHAILLAARERLSVRLWIHETDTPRPLEAHLINELAPPWNDQR